jgi:hypothetical protein
MRTNNANTPEAAMARDLGRFCRALVELRDAAGEARRWELLPPDNRDAELFNDTLRGAEALYLLAAGSVIPMLESVRGSLLGLFEAAPPATNANVIVPLVPDVVFRTGPNGTPRGYLSSPAREQYLALRHYCSALLDLQQAVEEVLDQPQEFLDAENNGTEGCRDNCHAWEHARFDAEGVRWVLEDTCLMHMDSCLFLDAERFLADIDQEAEEEARRLIGRESDLPLIARNPELENVT